MRITLFGARAAEVEPLFARAGLALVEEAPDVVVSYGGDGTLLLSEARYPGVPKLILRASRVCKLCPPFSNEDIVGKFARGEYEVKNIMKLSAEVGARRCEGLNDIVVHNADPRHAMRYRVRIDGAPTPPHEIIGDGVVVATPFGSSGYYQSIARGTFLSGIGLAFNNSTERLDHLVVGEDSVVEVRLERGPAIVYADNQEEFIPLAQGDVVRIAKSPRAARVIEIPGR